VGQLVGNFIAQEKSMILKRRTCVVLAVIVGIGGLVLTAGLLAQKARLERLSTGETVVIEHDGREREYRVFVPRRINRKNDPAPLVVCLHGGGGNASQVSRMGMSGKATKHQFVVAYPNAIDSHWNDGRDAPRYAEHDQEIDDVAFILKVVDELKANCPIDSDRVFVMGVSNGGFMSQRLAMEHSQVFSAAGIVIASMGEAIKEKFAPELPVSMLFMNGTDDPLVPYDGGEVTVEIFPSLRRSGNQAAGTRGYCVSTDDVVSMWCKRNKLSGKPAVAQLPNKNKDDGSRVESRLWRDGELGTAVALYKVVGGGHTIPGRKTPLPEKLVGQTNEDIDALEVIWQFFANHGRKTPKDVALKVPATKENAPKESEARQSGKNVTVSPAE